MDWKTWTLIGLLVIGAAIQGFFFWKKRRNHQQAVDDANIFQIRKGEGYLFFPAGFTYYRSFYIDPQGFKLETDRQSLEVSWKEVASVRKNRISESSALRDTYNLVFNIMGQDEPLVIKLGSFRHEEVKSITREIKRYVQLTKT